MGKLAGSSALITGASAGIGRACAMELARLGVDLLLTGRNAEKLREVVDDTQRLGVESKALAGDLTDPSFVRVLADASAECDIFVNNAGILTYAPLLETDMHNFEAMFQTNVTAAFAITLEVAKAMALRRKGHIVFITSGSARNVNQYGVVYAATKHALSAFAKGFRLELKPLGVRVTEVAPGMVDTAIRENSQHPTVVAALGMRKFKPLSPEDVAESVMAALTASEGASIDLIELRPRDA